MKDSDSLPDADFSVTTNLAPLTEPQEVSVSSAFGSDKIPTRLYKGGAIFFAEPLSHLFNTCEGVLPDAWKLTNICPTPNTTPTRVDALRSISLLFVPAKLLNDMF